jgi:ABC-type sugar transport system permease subunit
MGRAAATSFTFLLLIFAVSFIYTRLLRRDVTQ